MSAFEDLASLVTFRPLERPLSGARRGSPFSASWSSTVELLGKELRAHGARTAVMELDMREQDFRLDGLPRANARAASPGIVLSFQATAVPGRPNLRYEVATFAAWEANIRAIALGLESLRAVDRHGVTERGEQYAGWKALPAGADDRPSATRGKQLVYEHGGVKAALLATHPDHGGDPGAFRDVRAFQEAGA